MLITISLLCIEYTFLLKQSGKLQKLKSEYRIYVRQVKKILNTYMRPKKDIPFAFNKQNDEIALLVPLQDEIFFSQQYSTLSKKRELLPINRGLEHLKQASLAYVKKYDEKLMHYYDPALWIDYTEQQLTKDEQTASTLAVRKDKIESKEIDIDFLWPINQSKFWLSSLFGPRKKPNGQGGFHYGIDMAALKGTPVMAAASGTIEQAYEDPTGYGKTILIKHSEKYKTRYAHLDKMFVQAGQTVPSGVIIGHVGDTGNVRKQGKDASHLHFELYALGKRVNPLYFLN